MLRLLLLFSFLHGRSQVQLFAWDVRDPDDNSGRLDVAVANGLIRGETYRYIWRSWVIKMHDEWRAGALEPGQGGIRIKIDAHGGDGAERMILVNYSSRYGLYASSFINGNITDYETKVKRPNSRSIRVSIDQHFLNYSFPQAVRWWVVTDYEHWRVCQSTCIDRAPDRGAEEAVI